MADEVRASLSPEGLTPKSASAALLTSDVLREKAVSQYRAKLLFWFNSRFHAPTPEVPCAELKKLGMSVIVSIAGDRSVASYLVTAASGNSMFDERVRSTSCDRD